MVTILIHEGSKLPQFCIVASIFVVTLLARRRRFDESTQLAPPRVRRPPIGQIKHFSIARSKTKYNRN